MCQYKLNKAYLSIVRKQSYIFGRDANLTSATNVFKQVDESQAPLPPEHHYNLGYAFRLVKNSNVNSR